MLFVLNRSKVNAGIPKDQNQYKLVHVCKFNPKTINKITCFTRKFLFNVAHFCYLEVIKSTVANRLYSIIKLSLAKISENQHGIF